MNGISKESKNSSQEDEKNLHPLAIVSNINPEDIPDIPVNKFLLRGNVNKDDKDQKDPSDRKGSRERKVSERDGNYRGGRRDWENRGFNRRLPMKTKSGRIIKGRGRFRFRTPSRSRSRSVTPPHWRKEENRVVKLSELAERKTKERTPKRDVDKHMDANHSSRPNRIRNTYTPEKKIERAVDYNALDYEDQSSDEHDTAKKQVASLVQYPLNQERNNVESEKNNKENEEEEDKIINERSQFLAEALGVQIKTGQEPAKQETKQASFVGQKNKPIVLHANISGPNDFGRARQRYVSENGNQEEKGGRNKFETEKPAGNQIMARNYRSNGRQDFDNRRPVNRQGREMDRRRPNKPFKRGIVSLHASKIPETEDAIVQAIGRAKSAGHVPGRADVPTRDALAQNASEIRIRGPAETGEVEALKNERVRRKSRGVKIENTHLNRRRLSSKRLRKSRI
ncbi:hypothetical protein HHI36_024366 [Cryptolaemus montrouzieri]|uniref:Uncharacterized protein n=1 Tax=Cryptolaemus montrouzieri TaxID=559131 RepID=A0ABD2MVS5_9CUCU